VQPFVRVLLPFLLKVADFFPSTAVGEPEPLKAAIAQATNQLVQTPIQPFAPVTPQGGDSGDRLSLLEMKCAPQQRGRYDQTIKTVLPFLLDPSIRWLFGV
jgi:hypothetical protein